MIRIKTISFRQAINNFFDIASTILFIIFTILVVLIFTCIFTYNIKDVDASELSILTYETLSKDILINKVLEDEMPILALIEKDNDKVIAR